MEPIELSVQPLPAELLKGYDLASHVGRAEFYLSIGETCERLAKVLPKAIAQRLEYIKIECAILAEFELEDLAKLMADMRAGV